MKRIITIPIIAMFIMCVLSPSILMAGNKTSYNIPMHKVPNNQSEHNMSLDPGGRRTRPMPIYCIINQDTGIDIIGLSENVIGYEIWDTSSEINFASFSEESDFLDYLFLQAGDFQIKLETENYYAIGYIKMN